MALDIFHIPKLQNGYREIFYHTGSIQYWEVPRGIQYLRIMCIGGGGGGAGGSAANNNGGAGGSSGSIIFSLVPAYAVPEILSIFVGAGGRGSTPGNTGGVGQSTYVQGLINLPYLCWAFGGNSSFAPGLGTNGGTCSSVLSQNVPLANQYYWYGFNGHQGGSASTGTGASITFPTSGILLTGGAGGGGRGTGTTYNSGGSIITPASQDLSYRLFNTINPSVNGAEMFTPLLLSTGGGGGNATSGVGGRGGDGGFGSGGGGGGSGPSAGGNGGNGGNGLVIIEAW